MSTRYDALAALHLSGAGATQRERIYAALRHGRPITSDALADLLRMRRSSVTARLNEMIKVGSVRKAGTILSSYTGVKVTRYTLA